MDRRGVTGFPMRLTLAVLLISLCIPSLTDMAEGFREDAGLNETQLVIDNMMKCARNAYYGGPGSSVNLHVNIPAGYDIAIGGTGADNYSVRILRNGEILQTQYSEHPVIRFQERTCTLSSSCDIEFTCYRTSDHCSVMVGPA